MVSPKTKGQRPPARNTKSRNQSPDSSSLADLQTDLPSNKPLLLTYAEAAVLCRVSGRTWRIWDAAGHIPEPVRIGRSVFWRPKELVAWIDAGCPDRHTWNVIRD